MNNIEKAVELISQSKNIVVSTGAGISVGSGIPAFRSENEKDNIWDRIDPVMYASIEAIEERPEEVWQVFIRDIKETIDNAEPSLTHNVIAELESLKESITVITQNVDGLHQKAGSSNVIEFHGTMSKYYCLDCEDEVDSSDIDTTEIPPKCKCGGIYRPDCVFFGEGIPENAFISSFKAVENCDLMIVIGTSAVVQPAASLPILALENHARVIEINLEETGLSQIADILIQGNCDNIMDDIILELKKEQNKGE